MGDGQGHPAASAGTHHGVKDILLRGDGGVGVEGQRCIVDDRTSPETSGSQAHKARTIVFTEERLQLLLKAGLSVSEGS